MNGNEYDPVIEQFERSESLEDKIECLFTLGKMTAKNQCKLWRAVIYIGIAILAAILFSDQISLTKIMGLIAGML